jgi:hypothetical protein
MKTEGIKKHEIVPRDMLDDRINSLTGHEGLNIADGEYCYVKLVGNHLLVGRAKIIMEE